MIRVSRLRPVLHALVLVLVCPLAAEGRLALAATYCVATSGNDSNPGTEKQPWATLKKAADCVNRGDTVLIKAGVYARTRGGQSAWRFTKAGTQEAPITYKAYGDGEVRISASEVLLPGGLS